MSISGGTIPFPGYSDTDIPKNNVVNHTGSAVVDTCGAADSGACYKGSVAGPNNSVIPAIVTYTGSTAYNVDWWYIGAESGYLNTFDAAGGVTKDDNDAAHGGIDIVNPPEHIGVSTNQPATTTNIDFSVVSHGGTMASQANDSSNPIPGQGQASLVYAFLDAAPAGSGAVWKIVDYATNTFLIGWNDSGNDDNHDDIMIVGRVSAIPIPGALPLFAGGLGMLGLLARRKRRSQLANV